MVVSFFQLGRFVDDPLESQPPVERLARKACDVFAEKKGVVGERREKIVRNLRNPLRCNGYTVNTSIGREWSPTYIKRSLWKARLREET